MEIPMNCHIQLYIFNKQKPKKRDLELTIILSFLSFPNQQIQRLKMLTD